MKDFTKKFKDGLSKTSDFLKKSSEDAAQKLREGAEKLSNIGPMTVDKVADVVNDVIAVLPLLEEAGYINKGFDIGIAVTPIIEVSFSKIKDLSEEELSALKEKHKDSRMFGMILSTLQTADSLSKKIKAEAYEFEETIVEITVPPSVSLRYRKRLDSPTNPA